MWTYPLFTRTVGQITVRAFVVVDDDADDSWMGAEDRALAVSEGWEAFGTIVEIERNGHTIGRDALWGSFVAGGADDPYLRLVARTQVGPEALADARRTLGRM